MIKDTVPPHKSQTRGNKPVPKPREKQVQRIQSLPSAPASKGLAFKQPQKQRATEKVIHSRLQKRSPWYSSITDPLHGSDAKIPDDTGVETGTCQLVERVTITSGANGTGGIRIITPYINKCANSNSTAIGKNLQRLNNSATPTTVVWGELETGGSGTFVPGNGVPFASVAGLQSITNQHRIVSAGFYVQPEVSLSNNSGEYCLFSDGFGASGSPLYTDYLNDYKSVSIPLSAPTNSGVVRWFPMSRQDWGFKSFLRADGTVLSYDDDVANAVPYWSMGFITACPAGVTFRLTIVINYEFIPKDNVLNVLDTSPSPQDSMEVDLVERWVQDMPLAKPISNNVISSSPSAVVPATGENDQGTGFGMMFNVIKELAPIALALL